MTHLCHRKKYDNRYEFSIKSFLITTSCVHHFFLSKKHFFSFFVHVVYLLFCMYLGRAVHVGGGRISASEIDVQNWCGNSMNGYSKLEDQRNTSKIDIPSLCVKCDCASGACYCCGAYRPQYCWPSQSDCSKQCQ